MHFEGQSLQCGANETFDVLLNGRVRIIQPRDGYRVNQDSLRLCEFVRPMPGASGIDLGAGCGIVAIVLALEEKVKAMVALELQERLVRLARRNVALNGLGGRSGAGRKEAGRAEGDRREGPDETDGGASSGPGARIWVIQGDIRRVERLFEPKSFHLAVSNPPYRTVGQGRIGPSAEKTIARHEQACSFQDLARAAAYLLKPEGVFDFCQLRERWQEIADALAEHDLIVTRKEDQGEVMLVEARQGP